MLSDNELLLELYHKCLYNDKQNGEVKYKYICKILKNLNIITNYDIKDDTNIIDLFDIKDLCLSQISMNNIIPRYYNDYQEYNKIGEGGFGKVYKVKHYLDDNIYAIKKISVPNQKYRELQSVFSEILIMSKLEHPNIIRYYNSWFEPILINKKKSPQIIKSQLSLNYDLTEQNDSTKSSTSFYDSDKSSISSDSNLSNDIVLSENRTQEFILFYIQMEYCDYTLEKIMDKISMFDKINILKQLLSATKYLHQSNIIHGDIKPKNILFSNNILKLSDFGLSTINKEENYLNTSEGTILYKDPFFKDKRMDIYSIGVIIIEIFCNFKTTMEKFKVLSELKNNVIPLNIPEKLQTIIYRCICSEKERFDIIQLESNINTLIITPLNI